MEEQIFCDGIGRIAIIGGIVRLDLFTYSPTETDANGNPRPILSHRIVMGTDGFLRSSEKVVEAVGLIGRARPQAQPQPQPQPQAAAAPPPPVQNAQPQWPPQPAVQPAAPAQPIHSAQPAPPPPAPPPPVQPAPPQPRSPFP